MQKLRVLGARKSFGPLVAVNDVTFEVNPGEMVTLLGPSGCGKTTTLRLIAGLEQGDGGQIFLGDRLLSDPRAISSCNPSSGRWAWCSRTTPSGHT